MINFLKLDHPFDKFYPVKVFILTIVLVSIFSALIFTIGADHPEGFLHFGFAGFTLGFLYSLPTFIIYYLAFIYFARKNLTPVAVKFRMILVTAILLPFPFYLMDMPLHKIDEAIGVLFPLIGLISAVIMTFLIPLKKFRS